jgi:hypothetical protein
MASSDISDKQQSPAVSPKLKACVETSIARLQGWARANGQNWEALTDPDALLLQALLTKTKGDIRRGIAPIFPRGEFKGLSGEGLTGRRWEKFLRWYGREIEAELAKVCTERAEPMIYPGRSSVRNGGHPDKSQAIYFVSFDRPTQLAGRRESENEPPGAAERAARSPASVPPGADGPRPIAGNTESPSERLPVPRSLPSPAGVFVSLPSTDGGGAAVGWFAAMALAFVVVTASAPAGNPLTNEFLRLLSAARDVLSGAIIVRF